jgi:riboflavin biosynthesis pyrimidine reductase
MRPPAIDSLTPLEVLADEQPGTQLHLPATLDSLYGPLAFPVRRPYVISNFVSTIDGVTSLAVPRQSAGGPISGFNEHDRVVMGLLRAVSSAVVVGAGTLRSVPKHVWTPEYVSPALEGEFRALRERLALSASPLNVIVSAGGRIDFGLRVFAGGEVDVLVLTTEDGAARINQSSLPGRVRVQVCPGQDTILAADVLEAAVAAADGGIILVEGGPRLMGDFFAERLLDELFLTVAPQIAGRGETERPGLVTGRTFAPEDPLWGTLVSVRRAGGHLFLRYAFQRDTPGS